MTDACIANMNGTLTITGNDIEVRTVLSVIVSESSIFLNLLPLDTVISIQQTACRPCGDSVSFVGLRASINHA